MGVARNKIKAGSSASLGKRQIEGSKKQVIKLLREDLFFVRHAWQISRL